MEENKKDVLPLEGEPLTTPQISEPVVNALAAALSKIETYVPTQYINDGPPDIDADHLNHAEQAIMRVTNLANGAADAISALQSQVTQLNNNLRNVDAVVKGSLLDYAKNVNTFENVNTGEPTTDIPDSARYCIAHIMCRANSWFISVEGRDNRLYMNYNNGTDWTGWNSTALKSDLTDNLNHKKQILPCGNYGDGNHSISNFTFGSNLYIAVGTSAKVQKRCSIISPNDSIQIPHPEGFITIVFNDTNHITVSGTTGNYQLREIRASDFLGV